MKKLESIYSSGHREREQVSQLIKALKKGVPVEVERLIEVMRFPDPTAPNQHIHLTLFSFIRNFCQYDPVFASLSLPEQADLGYKQEVYQLLEVVQRINLPEVRCGHCTIRPATVDCQFNAVSSSISNKQV